MVPSGEQFEIRSGDHVATIVEVGGGIRAYSVGGREVLQPYPLDAMCDGAHGAPLVPWPNRLGDGRYTFDGDTQQLALTEPEKGNAIHGLLRWRPWQAVVHEPDRVTMRARIHPMKGYPFALDVRIEHLVSEDGLWVRTTATNVGDRAAPYGCGHHPYLSPGAGASTDECTVELDAAFRIVTDPERQLPTGTEPVAGTPFDLRQPTLIGDRHLDDAFTELNRDRDGLAWVRLTGPDGRTVELWADTGYPVVQLYTADTLAPDRRRTGVAAEPMTCPADAFRTGEHLVRLEPGSSHSTAWGVRLT
jgi:aldose 1-epimerase